ncbi:hypothetical protein CLOM_g22088 [Closterium sp. NIES-68]|nr:hypothetical protein CLOM_g22088 [Closterium sp. NIES-68]
MARGGSQGATDVSNSRLSGQSRSGAQLLETEDGLPLVLREELNGAMMSMSKIQAVFRTLEIHDVFNIDFAGIKLCDYRRPPLA